MNFENTIDFAKKMDSENELKHFRERFYIPQHNGKDKIYFTGNSLGLQPKTAREYVNEQLDEWARLGGEGHLEAKNPWIPYHEKFSKQLSVIVGGLPEEVVAMNSLTVNLHLLMVSFYRPTRERFKIICEAKAFPSDQYAFETQVIHHGFDPATAIIEVKPRSGEHTIRQEDILSTIKEHGQSTAVVLFSGINYYSGQVFNMQAITKAAHDAGAYAGFDLAHAVGNIEMKLHDWDVDFACWCTYKYLNSGPGAVGGAYIHQKHAGNTKMPRFAGWWGYTKDTRFNMEKSFEPIPTAEGWLMSNSPIIGMAAHKAALDIFDEAGLKNLSRKGKQLSAYLIYILSDINKEKNKEVVEVITPVKEEERGCQVSFIVKENGKKAYDHLMANGVSAGWREPEVIRVAPVPLYNTYEDIWSFCNMVSNFIK